MLLNIRFSSKAVFNIQNDVHSSNSVIYENGAVKRVMFDGGYATFDAKGVPDGTTSCATMRGVCAWSPTCGAAPSR